MNHLPKEFLLRMQALLGDDFTAFVESVTTVPPVSIRINNFRNKNIFPDSEKTQWCDSGRYLATRPSFTFDPLFHAGMYYVQEAGSMLLEQYFKFINPDNHSLRVLDLCAAPGGKSTHLLTLLSNDSLLISNEIIPSRNKILQQNISRWGKSNVIVTQNQPADFQRLNNFFDVIVVDAPCSGEGLFRKDPDSVNEWSEQNVRHCISRQTEILNAVLPSLKPGGVLIYSTCTYEPGENDLQIETLINDGYKIIHPNTIPHGITKTNFGWQCYPHKIKAEGFYISAVQKESGHSVELKKNKFKSNDQYAAYLNLYLTDAENYLPMFLKDQLYAIPKSIAEIYAPLSDNLYIRKAGIHLGEIKGKDLIPAHDLALSVSLHPEIADLPLELEDAIRYLKCETIKTTTHLRGWMTVSFNAAKIGWIKSIPGRINNYFPRELRVLKDYF